MSQLFVNSWYDVVRSRPLELLIGTCIFFIALAGGAVEDVASAMLAVLFLVCLFYVRSWPRFWKELSRPERLILIGFALFAISGFVSFPNVEDDHEFVRHMGRYIRFLLIVPVYLMLSRSDLKLYRYLLSGVVMSGPAYLIFTLISLSQRPELPASWQYHHIVFGSIAMINAMIMAAVLVSFRMKNWHRTLLGVSMLCVLYASIMSQARGAWIALPVCVAAIVFMMVRMEGIRVKTLLVPLAVLLVLVAITPSGDLVERRYEQAVSEIKSFASGKNVATSVGGRLALWHVAFNVWKEHPLIGTGPGDFDEELRASQANGLYKNIEVHTNTHNIYMQSLATTGIVGFVVLCFAIILVPLWHFVNSTGDTAARLCGVVTVIAFAVLGMSESWILRAPLISVYLVYVITLAVTVSRRESHDGEGS